jgi:hypothetical protein
MAVVVYGADLLFREKIRTTAIECGVQISFLKSEAELKERLSAESKDTLIIDLKKSSHLLPNLSEKIKCYSGEVVGFYSHVELELAKMAQDAGVRKILPRSKFVTELRHIIKDGR